MVSILDAFEHGVDLPYLLNVPIPYLEDLFEAQIAYLKEKRKAEKEAMQGG